MERDDEQALLMRAREYDLAALGELYDRYSPKIYTYMLYHTGDQELAEDLTANVFTKMLDAIQSSKAWEQSFSGWLYRIAHNQVVDHFRRDSRYTKQPLDERLPLDGQDLLAQAEDSISSERVREAMAHLTEEQQMVIVLKFFEERSNLEVAEIMGKTEGAIKSLQYRALAALRRHL
ncbi:MAG: sigma-70 family RNA polymerase sigma factor [Chloroflexi bacterium]|nr:sigma-70 family RNA polymerase sigma factor [Chloroflexota bacterium]